MAAVNHTPPVADVNRPSSLCGYNVHIEATCFLRLLRGQTHAGAPGSSSRATAKLFFFFLLPSFCKLEQYMRISPGQVLQDCLKSTYVAPESSLELIADQPSRAHEDAADLGFLKHFFSFAEAETVAVPSLP